jgi:hypothetical protein
LLKTGTFYFALTARLRAGVRYQVPGARRQVRIRQAFKSKPPQKAPT